MILQKEFYFIRHGQTDHNKNAPKIDHEDISLNDTVNNYNTKTAYLPLGGSKTHYRMRLNMKQLIQNFKNREKEL